MLESVTQRDLRTQMEQHLLMVEEVLGGLDQFAQGLERRITRIEEGLGLEPEGLSTAGWVHGEHMVLKKKGRPAGLLDTYFLACPYWLPRDQGCAFIEKLKSGSQLAALLKSETGRGVL